MNDFYKDMHKINSAVKVYIKAVLWSFLIIALYVILCFFSNDFFTGFFTVIIPFVELSSTAIITYSFSESNYVLISTLPVKMKNITGIIFRLFEMICLISFAGCVVISLLSGNRQIIIQQLISTLIILSFGYICIWRFSSAELKLSLYQIDSGYKALLTGIIFYLFFSMLNVITVLLFEKLEKNLLFLIVTVIIVLLLSIAAVFIRKIFYNKAYKIIRGIVIKK